MDNEYPHLIKTRISLLGTPIWLETDSENKAWLVQKTLEAAVRSETKQTDPKPDKPVLSIPPGWRLVEDNEVIKASDYYVRPRTGGHWHPTHVKNIAAGFNSNRLVEHITQVIDIDLDRQPKELVAFALDNDDHLWFAYQTIPEYDGDIWFEDTSTMRVMVKSEHPTCEVEPKDSLLVRPEYWNKQND